MKEQTRLQLATELYEIFGDNLCMLRMGALFYQARPELGQLLIEATASDAPSDAPDELRESALRLVSSGDNMLQAVIDVLSGAQEYIAAEED